MHATAPPLGAHERTKKANTLFSEMLLSIYHTQMTRRQSFLVNILAQTDTEIVPSGRFRAITNIYATQTNWVIYI